MIKPSVRISITDFDGDLNDIKTGDLLPKIVGNIFFQFRMNDHNDSQSPNSQQDIDEFLNSDHLQDQVVQTLAQELEQQFSDDQLAFIDGLILGRMVTPQSVDPMSMEQTTQSNHPSSQTYVRTDNPKYESELPQASTDSKLNGQFGHLSTTSPQSTYTPVIPSQDSQYDPNPDQSVGSGTSHHQRARFRSAGSNDVPNVEAESYPRFSMEETSQLIPGSHMLQCQDQPTILPAFQDTFGLSSVTTDPQMALIQPHSTASSSQAIDIRPLHSTIPYQSCSVPSSSCEWFSSPGTSALMASTSDTSLDRLQMTDHQCKPRGGRGRGSRGRGSGAVQRRQELEEEQSRLEEYNERLRAVIHEMENAKNELTEKLRIRGFHHHYRGPY